MSKTNRLSKIEYITTPSGKPKAVIIKIKDWDKITETLNISSNKDLMKSLKRARTQLSKGEKLLSLEEVLEDL